MADFQTIYRDHPDRYDELVGAEDVDGKLGPALNDVHPLRGANVVDVGAGTGRITRLLLEHGANHVIVTEVESAMLERARRSLDQFADRVRFELADARHLPVASSEVDLAIAGWVFGHFRYWMPDDWRATVGAALDELDRVVRPGGSIIVIETLGTGTEQPAAPNPSLAEYYGWLESDQGFERRTIRTNYAFDSVDEAARITGFFFGPQLAGRVRSEQWTVVPECTGVWSRKRSQ
jgi:ubiquinone/menaquinone biosynthesis C-methylase UbiE